MVIKGIGVVFLKKKGGFVRIYRQGITRYSQEDEMIRYTDIRGKKFRIVSCLYPAIEGFGLYIQGEAYKRDRDTIAVSLPKLRSTFNTLVFSPDACNRPHTITVL